MMGPTQLSSYCRYFSVLECRRSSSAVGEVLLQRRGLLLSQRGLAREGALVVTAGVMAAEAKAGVGLGLGLVRRWLALWSCRTTVVAGAGPPVAMTEIGDDDDAERGGECSRAMGSWSGETKEKKKK